MDVLWPKTAIEQGIRIGGPEIEVVLPLGARPEEGLGVRTDSLQGRLLNFGSHFIAFRACRWADAGHQIGGSAHSGPDHLAD